MTLKEVKSRKLAAKRFTWSAKESIVEKQEEVLIAVLSRDGIETLGAINYN